MSTYIQKFSKQIIKLLKQIMIFMFEIFVYARIHDYFVLGGVLKYRFKNQNNTDFKVVKILNFDAKKNSICIIDAQKNGSNIPSDTNKPRDVRTKILSEHCDYEVILDSFFKNEKVLLCCGYGEISEIDFTKKDEKCYKIQLENGESIWKHVSQIYKNTYRNFEKFRHGDKFKLHSKDCEEKNEIYDVTIIGSGMAGISCCYHLTKYNPQMKIQMLEASERCGGRVKSFKKFF